MRLINADMIVYYEHTNADGKFVGELAWKDQIDNLPTYDGEMVIANMIERNKNNRKEIKALRAELKTLRKAYELMAVKYCKHSTCYFCEVTDKCERYLGNKKGSENLMEYFLEEAQKNDT